MKKYKVKMYGIKDTAAGLRRLPGLSFDKTFQSKEEVEEFVKSSKQVLKILKYSHTSEEMPEFFAFLADSGDFYTSITLSTEKFLKSHKDKSFSAFGVSFGR